MGGMASYMPRPAEILPQNQDISQHSKKTDLIVSNIGACHEIGCHPTRASSDGGSAGAEGVPDRVSWSQR
eukprot:256618-Rhodomonas_salina.1